MSSLLKTDRLTKQQSMRKRGRYLTPQPFNAEQFNIEVIESSIKLLNKR